MAEGCSVVVATSGERRDWLLRCVDSLKTQTSSKLEIIVVSLHAVPELQSDPSIVFVHEPRRGASIARNVGWKRARFSLVAFIDDDCVADSSWVSILLEHFSNTGTDLAGVTGRVLALRPGLYVVAPDTYDGPHTFGPPSSLEPPWKMGGGLNMVFRTQVLRAVSGFDAHLGPGSSYRAAEELDLFHRVLAAGYRIDYDPAAVVYHEPMDGLPEVVSKRFAYRLGLGALFAKHKLEPALRDAFWPFMVSELRNVVTAVLQRDALSFLICAAGFPGLLLGRASATIVFGNRSTRNSAVGG